MIGLPYRPNLFDPSAFAQCLTLYLELAGIAHIIGDSKLVQDLSELLIEDYSRRIYGDLLRPRPADLPAEPEPPVVH